MYIYQHLCCWDKSSFSHHQWILWRGEGSLWWCNDIWKITIFENQLIYTWAIFHGYVALPKARMMGCNYRRFWLTTIDMFLFFVAWSLKGPSCPCPSRKSMGWKWGPSIFSQVQHGRLRGELVPLGQSGRDGGCWKGHGFFPPKHWG